MVDIEHPKKIAIKFGLVAQGHISTIERELAQWGSNELSWMAIGRKIGWCHNTAAFHYIQYLMNKDKPTHDIYYVNDMD